MQNANTYDVFVDDCEAENDDFKHQQNDDENSILGKQKQILLVSFGLQSKRKLN